MPSPLPHPVPGPLAEWIVRFGGVSDPEPGAEEAVEGAIRALREAMVRSGRNREGAWALLAADALLTEAGRGLLGTGDPERALEALMTRVAGEEPE